MHSTVGTSLWNGTQLKCSTVAIVVLIQDQSFLDHSFLGHGIAVLFILRANV